MNDTEGMLRTDEMPVTVARVNDDQVSVGPFTPETFGKVAPIVVEQLGIAVAQLKVGFAEMGRAMASNLQAMRDMPPKAPPLDMSPRAVALRARQNRHTGPRGTTRRRRGR